MTNLLGGQGVRLSHSTVVDFLDIRVPMLKASFSKRQEIYHAA